MTKNKEREIKQVSLNYKNNEDLKILSFLEDNQIKFSTYVKELILNDINKEKPENNLDDVVAAINNLSTIIQNNSAYLVENQEKILSENQSEVVDSKKSIINNLLNMK